MTDISHESVDCRIVDDRDSAVKGDIYYRWDGDVASKRFPEDVLGLYIRMPVTWREIAIARSEPTDDMVDIADLPVDVYWATTHPRNMELQRHPRWSLSGTYDKPTLSPSLNWVGIWHGWLKNGRLESC